jgi:CDP-glucose 4,6-dehydratase
VARVLNPDFWRRRRVLVTGHTGFKGAWLSLWLQALGAEVAGFSLAPPSAPSLYDLARVGQGMPELAGDVRELDRVRAVVAGHRPEVVFHLGAQALVRRGHVDPVATFAVNALGTANVLEAARDVPATVVVTSDKVYAPGPDAHTEDDPLGGDDPYSASKACAELIAAAYRAEGARVATARAGNVIGGGDWGADRLVPDVLRAADAGTPVAVRNPDAVRPWQHVLEPLGGYLLLAERLAEDPAVAGAWNFGPAAEDARPVRWVVERLCAALGAAWREAPGGPAETPVLRLDASKARALLGWEPRWTLEEALARVVEWHRALAAGDDPRETTLAQIAAYAEVTSRSRPVSTS